MKVIIHWFRRDLRLRDNPALAAATRDADEVVPVFVIDPAILARPDCGPNLTAFFFKCVESLAAELEGVGSRLVLLHGDPLVEIPRLVKQIGAAAVYHGRDYEPFAKERDAAMAAIGKREGFVVRSFKDVVVFESREVRKEDGGIYTVFTPYSRRWKKNALPELEKNTPGKGGLAATLQSEKLPDSGWQKDSEKLQWAGFGEAAARALLERFLEKAAAGYADNRNFPGVEGTSRLSPHLRAGTISPRQIIHAVEGWKAKQQSKAAQHSADVFISEIIWRDFYQGILDEFPHVTQRSFRPEYEAVQWPGCEEHFVAWCEGRTGYPIVDAAMRQLVATGWMHNRLRMIVAMFLTKDLHIHWQRGEEFFMRHLADGDCAANNGGWQWSASTGTDAAPYFRIFAPLSQSEKFDPEGEFIRKWVPELANVRGAAVHAPSERAPLEWGKSGYPAPIVDHAKERLVAMELYKVGLGRV